MRASQDLSSSVQFVLRSPGTLAFGGIEHTGCQLLWLCLCWLRFPSKGQNLEDLLPAVSTTSVCARPLLRISLGVLGSVLLLPLWPRGQLHKPGPETAPPGHWTWSFLPPSLFLHLKHFQMKHFLKGKIPRLPKIWP